MRLKSWAEPAVKTLQAEETASAKALRQETMVVLRKRSILMEEKKCRTEQRLERGKVALGLWVL